MLIVVLLVLGLLAIAAVAVLLSSRPTAAEESEATDPRRVESQVYEELYGRRHPNAAVEQPQEEPAFAQVIHLRPRPAADRSQAPPRARARRSP
jgi:type II secretory pathway pseudopilin PulG